MTFDANESERLWRTLAQLNEQVGRAVDLSTENQLRLERFERTFLKKSERAAHVGARKGARYQALLVSAVIGVLQSIATYYAVKSQTAQAHEDHHVQAGIHSGQ